MEGLVAGILTPWRRGRWLGSIARWSGKPLSSPEDVARYGTASEGGNGAQRYAGGIGEGAVRTG